MAALARRALLPPMRAQTAPTSIAAQAQRSLSTPSAPLLPAARAAQHLPARLSSRSTHSTRTIATATAPPPPPRDTSTDQPPSTSDLLSRRANRPLPSLSSLSSARRWLTTIPIFLAIITVSALGLFNYQKVNSPLVAATLYSLRTNGDVRAELGDEVYFASKWAWIRGSINLVKGKVDVWFRVKGTRGRVGVCRFRAKRLGGKGGTFYTTEWSLTMEDNGQVIQLLGPDGRDPLAGAKV